MWEKCRLENITYSYPTKEMPKKIKDKKMNENIKMGILLE
jgi:hypothetical protein